MAVMTEIKTPLELKTAGMKALVKEIGAANARKFVKHCKRCTPGWDFGEWLNEQPEQTLEEVKADILRVQADNAATGRYADKMI